VIGCEFATIFSNYGRTKVFLIDKEDRILPFEDEDISAALASNLEKNGVVIHRGSSLESMNIVNGKVEYVLNYKDGRHETYTVDHALISVGRVANTDNLGLEAAGVQLNDRGYCVDNATQTTVSNIYAVGDFTADISLVNVGELEGRYAVERIFGKPPRDLIYDNISTIMFLNPEVAAVGMNETQARKRKIPYRMAVMDYRYINRAIAMGKTGGFFKILVSDDDEMKILGMRVMGNHASSTSQAIALMIALDAGIDQLAELIFPHPSVPEGIQECARMLRGKSIVKPEVFNLDLRCYRVDAEGRVENLYH
jgi:dihydrolipoamide dehydrogenase